jgi:hypothetical protein
VVAATGNSGEPDFYLLTAKHAANRPQNQADIEFLEELQRLGNPS